MMPIPLLRTELMRISVRVYKHLTPKGVKTEAVAFALNVSFPSFGFFSNRLVLCEMFIVLEWDPCNQRFTATFEPHSSTDLRQVKGLGSRPAAGWQHSAESDPQCPLFPAPQGAIPDCWDC